MNRIEMLVTILFAALSISSTRAFSVSRSARVTNCPPRRSAVPAVASSSLVRTQSNGAVTTSVVQRHSSSLLLLLSSTSSNDDSSDDNKRMAKKVAGRKKRVMMGYRISFVLYSLLGLGTWIPGFIRPQMIPIVANYAAGPLLASGVAYILADAAENDRLSSDTYKRLNLFLSKFGFFWLAAAVLVRQTKPLTRGAKIVSNPIVVLASLSALINGIKGWGYGVKGWDKQSGTLSFGGAMVEEMKSFWKLLVTPFKNVTASIYLLATLLAAFMQVVKLVDAVELLQDTTGAASAAKFGSLAMAYAKLSLLTAVSFTLKDAADRDRLEGTTFVELNLLSSVTWVSIGAYLLQAGQARLGCSCTLVSLFSLFTGAKSLIQKRNKS